MPFDNLRTLKLSTKSGGMLSRNRFELSALKNLRSLEKRCLIVLIGHGGKRSFSLSRNIRGPLFTTRQQVRASFLFTPATETKACGICPEAAWGRYPRAVGDS